MDLSEVDNSLGERLLAGRAPSGLNVILNPKPGFSKTMGILAVRFGSADEVFESDGTLHRVPEGTAHFLEHKLFEGKEGDVSDLFSANGASCNAGTGFITTSYLFTGTGREEENLKLLLQFVQTPYFTEELIEKEQGIIGQEIRMYDDDPDWILFFNLLGALYRDHPVRKHIAGTLDSIRCITPVVLHRCYDAFYRPGNMVLVVTGRMDPAVMAHIVEEDARGRIPDRSGVALRRFEEADPSPARSRMSRKMMVARPKVLVGYKDFRPHPSGPAQLFRELASQIAVDGLFGRVSGNYERLYREGLVDDSFSAHYSGYADFGFTLLGGDTDDPDTLVDRLLAMAARAAEEGMDEDTFRREKNKQIGRFIRSFNAVESAANTLVNLFFKNVGPEDALRRLEALTLEEVNRRIADHFDPARSACSIVLPRNGSGPGEEVGAP